MRSKHNHKTESSTWPILWFTLCLLHPVQQWAETIDGNSPHWSEQTKSCFIDLKLSGRMEIRPHIPPLTDTDSHLLGSSPSLIEQTCRAALWGLLRPGLSALCTEHKTDRHRHARRQTASWEMTHQVRRHKNPLVSILYFTFFQSILTSGWRLHFVSLNIDPMAVLGPLFLFFVMFFPRNILLCKCTTVHLKQIENADTLDAHLPLPSPKLLLLISTHTHTMYSHVNLLMHIHTNLYRYIHPHACTNTHTRIYIYWHMHS